MVDKLQVENPLNKPMHYGNERPLVNEVVPVVNYLPSVNLYSGLECNERYNQMQQDLYVSQKVAAPKKKGLPKILKILAAAFGGYILYAVAKPSVAKVFNKIFRRG